MTLGGLALAVGMLVDDATVAIENINWHLEQGKDLEPAILEGSDQIAIPAFVSTICICIVFVPMFFLTGVARYLFVPMAEAVVFAMLASYVLSRTLVPTMAKYLLHAHEPHGEGRPSRNPAGDRSSAPSIAASCACATAIAPLLEQCVGSRRIFTALFLGGCHRLAVPRPLGRRGLLPGGRRRTVQAAPARVERHAHRGDGDPGRPRRGRAARDHPGRRTGRHHRQHRASLLRLEPVRTARRRRSAPATPTSWCRSARDIGRPPSTSTICGCRCRRRFPGVTFSFVPADIVTQILNFGLPAPIDIQIVGRNIQANRVFAGRLVTKLAQVPGIADLRVQQEFNQPPPAPRRRPHPRRATRPDPARRRHQPADLALGQQPDDADLVAEPEHRSQLRRRHPDAAVPGRLAAGSRQHSDHRRRSRPDAAGAGDGHPRCRHPGLVALQRRAGDRHLRRGAGTRSGQRRARHQPDSRRGSEGAAARLADHRARADRHDDHLVHRVAGRAGAWRSCWCIC